MRIGAIRIDQPDWFTHAACTGHGPKPWFPERGQSTAPAKAICERCPVHRQCLDHALADDTLAGIWAGTTETERDQIRRKRRTA